MSIPEIVQAITVTAELTGTQLSGAAMAAMAGDLMNEYPEPAILQALSRCRRELTGRLTQAAVVERIQSDDGRPSANEAWGIALSAFDEAVTVVTNEEISEAMAAARPVMNEGDEVGARMAFRDCYDRVIRRNRMAGIAPKWYPSLGHDPMLRIDAIKLAEDRGLLTHAQAAAYLPAPMTDEEQKRGAVIAGLLTGEVAPMPKDQKFRERIGEIMTMLKKEQAA